MITVSVLLTLRIYEARSLKDRRAVVQSLVERLRRRHHLSVATMAEADTPSRAQIGFAAVSESPTMARELARRAIRFAEEELLGKGEIVASVSEESALRA